MSIPPRTDAEWRRGITRDAPRGRLALWVLDPGLLIFQIVSHGDESFVEPVVEGLERCLRQSPHVQLFVDTELMTTYDSELRTRVTAALLAERPRIAGLHIVVRSKLVAMGVSVANLALGGLMTIHKDFATFLEALQLGTHTAGVDDFCANDLLRERKRRSR